jgi:hypothetical protein
VAAGPPPLPLDAEGTAIEVDRAVNNSGLVGLGGRQVGPTAKRPLRAMRSARSRMVTQRARAPGSADESHGPNSTEPTDTVAVRLAAA